MRPRSRVSLRRSSSRLSARLPGLLSPRHLPLRLSRPRSLSDTRDLGRMLALGAPIPGRTRGHADLAAHHEALGCYRWRGLLRLALLQDLLDRSRGLIVIKRRRVALDVVPERRELGDDLFVVELNAVALELFRDFVNALLRHTLLGLLLRRLRGRSTLIQKCPRVVLNTHSPTRPLKTPGQAPTPARASLGQPCPPSLERPARRPSA